MNKIIKKLFLSMSAVFIVMSVTGTTFASSKIDIEKEIIKEKYKFSITVDSSCASDDELQKMVKENIYLYLKQAITQEKILNKAGNKKLVSEFKNKVDVEKLLGYKDQKYKVNEIKKIKISTVITVNKEYAEPEDDTENVKSYFNVGHGSTAEFDAMDMFEIEALPYTMFPKSAKLDDGSYGVRVVIGYLK